MCKEHLSLSRAWEDAKHSHAYRCNAPGRAAPPDYPEGLSRGFQPYSTRTPVWPPKSFLSQSPGTPVWQRGWSCILVMFKGEGGKIKQTWGGGVEPEQGNGFEAKKEHKGRSTRAFNNIFRGAHFPLTSSDVEVHLRHLIFPLLERSWPPPGCSAR